MATKKLKSQVMNALLHIIESLIIFGICAYCSVQVYFHGTGTHGKGRGLKGIFAKWLYAMEAQGNQTLVNTILFGMFGVAAIAGFLALIYHLLHLTPGRTRLGRSVKKQAASYEKLHELIETIDTDMERESMEFGTELRIGTQWILSEEAMRVNQIQQISVEDKRNLHILSVTDKQGNTLKVDFAKKESLDGAARCLRRKLPGLSLAGMSEMVNADVEEKEACDIPETKVPKGAGDSNETRDLRALAFAAPLRAVTYEYQKELGSESTSGRKQEKMQKKLAKQWSVGNAAQLTEKIKELYLGEKASEYDRLLLVLDCPDMDCGRELLPDGQMDEERTEAFLGMLQRAETLFEKYEIPFPKARDTLYAWDLANAALLTVHGAKAGYLNREEELLHLAETGRLAGLFYDSWEGYAGAFLLGYFMDEFFKLDSEELLDTGTVGKSEVKEIRGFLRDKEFMACPFAMDDSRYAPKLPEHYQPEH